MNITDNPAKKEIVARLLKEGNISFEESILLLEEPISKEYVPFNPNPFPLIGKTDPYNPYPVTYTSAQ